MQTIEQIARELAGRPLIVRTLDVGADKPLPALPIAPEAEPVSWPARASGSRSSTPSCSPRQLRAILRVAAEHPVQGDVPDGGYAGELEAALGASPRRAPRPAWTAPLEVGIMVEVPAAALQAGQLAAAA